MVFQTAAFLDALIWKRMIFTCYSVSSIYMCSLYQESCVFVVWSLENSWTYSSVTRICGQILLFHNTWFTQRETRQLVEHIVSLLFSLGSHSCDENVSAARMWSQFFCPICCHFWGMPSYFDCVLWLFNKLSSCVPRMIMIDALATVSVWLMLSSMTNAAACEWDFLFKQIV